MRATILTLLVALALAPAAAAGHGPYPWEGGVATTTPFEAFAAQLAGEIAGTSVIVHCNGDNDWGLLAAGKFDPARVWGYVPGGYYVDIGLSSWRPIGYTHLSPQACSRLDEFWAASPKPPTRCQTGTERTTELVTVKRKVKVWVKKRVKVKGKWQVRRVRATRVRTEESVVAKDVPVMGLCDGYRELLFAVQTLAHEAEHLAGTPYEDVAECHALQRFAWFAERLGASPEAGRQMAVDYWEEWYVAVRPGSSYYSEECRDGGALDLNPGSAVWPSP